MSKITHTEAIRSQPRSLDGISAHRQQRLCADHNRASYISEFVRREPPLSPMVKAVQSLI